MPPFIKTFQCYYIYCKKVEHDSYPKGRIYLLIIISFLVFALLGGYIIIRASGIIIFIGFLIGLAVIHLGIWKKYRLVIVLGVVMMILSFLLPSFMFFN
jgi:hypothetical protein